MFVYLFTTPLRDSIYAGHGGKGRAGGRRGQAAQVNWKMDICCYRSIDSFAHFCPLPHSFALSLAQWAAPCGHAKWWVARLARLWLFGLDKPAAVAASAAPAAAAICAVTDGAPGLGTGAGHRAGGLVRGLFGCWFDMQMWRARICFVYLFCSCLSLSLSHCACVCLSFCVYVCDSATTWFFPVLSDALRFFFFGCLGGELARNGNENPF